MKLQYNNFKNYNMMGSNYQNKFYWNFQAKWGPMWTGSKRYVLSYFVTGFLTLSGKTNGVQLNAGHDNTEQTLTANLACIFSYHFLFNRRNER